MTTVYAGGTATPRIDWEFEEFTPTNPQRPTCYLFCVNGHEIDTVGWANNLVTGQKGWTSGILPLYYDTPLEAMNALLEWLGIKKAVSK